MEHLIKFLFLVMGFLFLFFLTLSAVFSILLFLNKFPRSEETKQILSTIFENLKDLFLSFTKLFLLFKEIVQELTNESSDKTDTDKPMSQPISSEKNTDKSEENTDKQNTEILPDSKPSTTPISSSEEDTKLPLSQEPISTSEDIIDSNLPSSELSSLSVENKLDIKQEDISVSGSSICEVDNQIDTTESLENLENPNTLDDQLITKPIIKEDSESISLNTTSDLQNENPDSINQSNSDSNISEQIDITTSK